MALLFTNNAVSTLAAGLSIGSTNLTVQAGDGALFPNPSGNDSYLITLQDASNNIEILEVTNRVGDAMTVVRAREGTADQSWLSGDSVELRITAGVLSQYRQGVGDAVVTTAINRSLGLADRHDFIECTAAVTITLPAVPATVTEGYQVTVKNSSTALVTVNRANAGNTINGALQDVSIPPNASLYFSVNSTLDGYITLHSDLQAVYPVGAIYMSTVVTNPATVFGFGTWEQIPGRFLVGVGDNGDGKSYAADEEGGQKDAIVPNHTHPLNDPGHGHNIRGGGNDDDGGARPPGGNNDSRMPNAILNSTTGITMSNPTNGEGVTDKNLPPYYAVYIFKRTA